VIMFYSRRTAYREQWMVDVDVPVVYGTVAACLTRWLLECDRRDCVSCLMRRSCARRNIFARRPKDVRVLICVCGVDSARAELKTSWTSEANSTADESDGVFRRSTGGSPVWYRSLPSPRPGRWCRRTLSEGTTKGDDSRLRLRL